MAITSSAVLEVPPAFRGTLGHANMLLGLLRSIRVFDRPKCIFTLTHEGLRATCENSRVMQGSAILPKSIFQKFDLRCPDISVKVNLNVLLTCFSSAANELDPQYQSFQTSNGFLDGEEMSMDLVIRDENSPLELAVTEGQVTTELALGAEEGGFSVFPEILPHNMTSRLTLPSGVFAEMYSEFDLHSEDMGFRVDPNVFRIFFESVGGRSDIVVHKTRPSPEDRIKYEYLCQSVNPNQTNLNNDSDNHHTYLFRLDLFKVTIESLLRSFQTIITTTYAQTSIRYQCLIDKETHDAGIFAEIEYVMIAKANVDGDPYPTVRSLPIGIESLHLTDDSDNLPAGADFTTVHLQQQNGFFSPSMNRTSENELLTADQPPAVGRGTYVQHPTQSVHHSADLDYAGQEQDDTFDDDDLLD